MLRKAADFFVALFLLANLVIRFSTMFHYPPYNGYIALFLGAVVLGCVGVVFFQKYLKVFLFVFGFSFFLFGFPSMTLQSRVFELIVTCVATSLLLVNLRVGKDGGQRSESSKVKGERGKVEGQSSKVKGERNKGKDGEQKGWEKVQLNRTLVLLILCYVGLSFFSLLLLPVRQIFRDFWFFGFPDFFLYVFIAQPYHVYYPLPAILRLILYVILAVELASLNSRMEVYKSFFLGLFSGGIFCAFIGLLDFYGIISLQWYRFGKTATPGVLHSTFWNRGVFGEFTLSVVPFVLIGFMRKTKRVWFQVLLFCSLVVCEIALLLAGARAGWVSYPLILLICWVFFYFSKEGRFDSFRFTWKDFVKLAVSVPLTIVVSFFLIFYVFMPLSEHLKEGNKHKGIQKNAAATSRYLQRQASRIINPSERGRLYTWKQGYLVGMENPVFGMGYESFCRNAHVLKAIPESNLHKFYEEKGGKINLSAHGTLFQVFASGGVVGVFLWVMIVGYAILLLLFDLIKNKRLLNIPVIISIISFHTYGIFQSMQYVPMIWCIIFLNLGYALTLDGCVLPGRIRRWMGVGRKAAVLLVVIGFFVYFWNFESRCLAEKYGRRAWAFEQDEERFAGFFEHWNWNYGDYWWFSKRAAIRPDDRRQTTDDGNKAQSSKVKGERRKGQRTEDGGRFPEDRRQKTEGRKTKMVALEFYCRTPGLEEEPVVLTVSYDGRVLDEVVFEEKVSRKAQSSKVKGQTVQRVYELPAVDREEELLLEVSRTWIPHEVLGNFDRRELGVGVKVMEGRRRTTDDGRQRAESRGLMVD